MCIKSSILQIIAIACLSVACSPKNKTELAETVPPVKLEDGSIIVKAGGKIQEAINLLKNTGGTISVEPGEYVENIQLVSGIQLLSSEKLGATIKPSNSFKYTITGFGVTNVSVHDFAIEGGIEFGQVTSDFSQVSDHISIIGNKISNNHAKDGIHLGGVTSVVITDNEISNSDTEQGIDLVGVKEFTVAGNKVHDILNTSGMGIVAKGGSLNGTISGNELYNCGNAAIACGQVSDELWIWPEAKLAKYEAKNIAISKNTLYNNAKFAVLVMGATDSNIDSNTIGPTSYYALIKVASSEDTHSPAWVSKNITITQANVAFGNIDLANDATSITLNGTKLR